MILSNQGIALARTETKPTQLELIRRLLSLRNYAALETLELA